MTITLLMPQTALLIPASPPRAARLRRDLHGLLPAFMLMAGLGLSAAQAQGIYKSVGPDGRIVFSDRPAAQAGQRTTPVADTTAAPTLPSDANAQLLYALRQTANRYPVVLYSAKDCQPCDDARRFLQTRGIPFVERLLESQADQSALQKLSGRSSLPFATIGKQHLNGFSESSWSEYLAAAGYPPQSQLPANYRPAPPVPLTRPAPAAPAPGKEAAQDTPAAAARPAANPPPGTPTPGNPAGLRF
jgi:glutaredoxin